MDTIFGEFTEREYDTCYIDGVILNNVDDDELLELLDEMLQRLGDNSLTLKLAEI